MIPSFNQGDYLEQAIQSVLKQDYPDLELFVIDGGSQDSSLEVIKKYSKQIKYWVSEPDHGQSYAINKGFEKCSGDLITFQNSDDIYLPGSFIFAAEKWKQNPDCGAIVGGFKYINETTEISQESYPPRLPYRTPLDLTLISPGEWRLHQVATFYSKKALDLVGRYVREDLQYVMDRELLFRVCKNYHLILDQRNYAAFRRHSKSKTMTAGIRFGNEFSQLYTDSFSGGAKDDHKRERFARFYRAKGYLHHAKYHPDSFESNKSFVKTIAVYPQFIFTRNFWSAFVKRNLPINSNVSKLHNRIK